MVKNTLPPYLSDSHGVLQINVGVFNVTESVTLTVTFEMQKAPNRRFWSITDSRSGQSASGHINGTRMEKLLADLHRYTTVGSTGLEAVREVIKILNGFQTEKKVVRSHAVSKLEAAHKRE